MRGKGILLMGFFMLLLVHSSWASEPLSKADVYKALSKIGVKGIEIVALEPSPVKGLTMVFIKSSQGRMGTFLLTEDGQYLISGRMLDLNQGGKDLAEAIGIEKGYFPMPKGRDVNVALDLKGSPSFGPAKAPQVIVYFDPLCPYCLRELSDLRKLAIKGEIHLILKYFIVHGERAKEIAVNSECVRRRVGNEAYWRLVFAKGKGISEKGTKGCNKESIAKLIDRDSNEAKRLGVRGTPASIIKNRLYVGYQGSEIIEKLIVDSQKVRR